MQFTIDTLLGYLLLVVPWFLVPLTPKLRLSLASRLVFATCSVSLCFACMEILLRLGFFFDDKRWVPPQYISLRDSLSVEAVKEADGHPLGLRDPHRSIRKEPGTIRIAVLGDSFVWGTGLHDSDRWTRKLEHKLNVQRPDLEVLHWGREAWSTRLAIEFLKSHYEEWEIDMVVLSFNTNDLDMGDTPQWELGMGYGLSSDPFRTIYSVYPYVANFLGGQLRNFIESIDTRYGYANWEGKLWQPANHARYRTMIKEFKGYLTSRGLPCLVVLLPASPDKYYGEHLELIERDFREAGFDVVNTYPEVIKREATIPRELLRAHRGDFHPGPGLTEVFADVVAERILESDLHALRKIPQGG